MAGGGGRQGRWRGLTFLATDHLGTPACALAGDASVTWSGGFEPFGRDWQHGTPEGALASGLFLRLPGQWDHPYWHRDLRTEGFGADLFYNVHRWYEAGTGRYTRTDPANRGLLLGGIDAGRFFTPSTLGMFAGPYSDGLSTYGYAASNPLLWVDPLGLAACKGAAPAMPHCKSPGSGCCVLACITELRAMICKYAEMDPWLDLVGAGLAAYGGAQAGGAAGGLIAGPPGIPTGACIGAAVAAAAEHYAQEWVEDWAVQQVLFPPFKKCIQQDCNVRCTPDRPCSIERQFGLTVGEALKN
ncbi:MAG: hypothetical protein M5U13_07900 [Thermoanaerobaculia bacterium]|nr:hypothetical protein [Thermoanaerobaculia bacterium]